MAEKNKELVEALNPFHILQQAVDKGTSVEVLERLVALAERYEKTVAKKAFDKALIEMRPSLPSIFKTELVDYGAGTGKTRYRYENLSKVTEVLAPVMANYGFSYRWRTESRANGNVVIAFILSHEMGHSEESWLEGPPDRSGSKNPAQAIGSIQKYLMRYTMEAGVGVVAAGEDDDGRGSSPLEEADIRREQEQKQDDVKEDFRPLRVKLWQDILAFCEGDKTSKSPARTRATSIMREVAGKESASSLSDTEAKAAMEKFRSKYVFPEDPALSKEELEKRIEEQTQGKLIDKE